MAKAKTSLKRKTSSKSKIPPSGQLRAGVTTSAHDPVKRLKDPELVVHGLIQCLLQGDTEGFKEILAGHYEARNTTKELKRVSVSRRTYYAAVSKDGNPSLETISKLLKGIKSERA